jgi:hypothetical protein
VIFISKDCYFFSHDSNAKDDPKCVMLIEQLGLEGFGIYWVLIEVLRDQPTYKYPISLIPAIARRYNTTAEKMKIVVNGYGLFEVDEDQFFSMSLLNRMGKMEKLRTQRVEAGKKSAEKRLLLNENPTSVERALNENPTDVQQLKESKVKEKKVNKNIYGEFKKVLLTEVEYDRLCNKYGKPITDKSIEFLDLHIEEKDYKSKSHCAAIQKWVVNAVMKQQPYKNTQQSQQPVKEDYPEL